MKDRVEALVGVAGGRAPPQEDRVELPFLDLGHEGLELPRADRHLDPNVGQLRLEVLGHLTVHQVAADRGPQLHLEPLGVAGLLQQVLGLGFVNRIGPDLGIAPGRLGNGGIGHDAEATDDVLGQGLFVHGVVDGLPDGGVLQRTAAVVQRHVHGHDRRSFKQGEVRLGAEPLEVRHGNPEDHIGLTGFDQHGP